MVGRTVEHLLADVTFALEQGLGARDLLPMLQRLAKEAVPGSAESHFAKLCLARHLLDTNPFRAARLSRAIAHEDPTNDEAWGTYGISLTLLGHYRAARKALQKACALAPDHPGHAHNLGHLLDIGFDRPLASLRWLKMACLAAPEVPNIASSYAHALLRTGRRATALNLLRTHCAMDIETANQTLEQWSKAPNSL
jgi:Flp pilus assembly protein TadD